MAPDRIWISEASEGTPETWTEVETEGWPEYIRRDAFPVEELKELRSRMSCQSSLAALEGGLMLDRILSLLEGE